MRTTVYVDGFNLYYGALKGTAHKWLDLDALCRRLLPRDDITLIRYFTARVTPRPDNPAVHTRQNAYLRALATIPHLTVHLGHYQMKTTRMPLASPPSGGPRTVRVIKTEEKGSDVNLATYLVFDACQGAFDTAVVISNDSDLAEPIRIVRHELGLKVGIINPHPAHMRSRGLEAARPTFIKQIRPSVLAACQFPDRLRVPSGYLPRPAKW